MGGKTDPLEPPSVNPLFPPLVTVSINGEWWPYVLGLCEEMLSRSYFDVSEADYNDYMYEWVQELLTALTDAE